jgi:surface antigen
MQKATSLGHLVLLATLVTGSMTALSNSVDARTHKTVLIHPVRHGGAKLASGSGAGRRNAKYVFTRGARVRYAHATYGGLQCVPFARAASGIELKGNAADWWDAAEGVYQRGAAPEAGSVLNFRATGRMRLGHVAVVTAVVDSRHIQIEHANWYKGSVSRNTPVEDVSPENDWSEVRVGIGGGNFGSVYPTYGFIYDRPDSGTMLANAHPSQAPEETASVQEAGYAEVAEMLPRFVHKRRESGHRTGASARLAAAHRTSVPHRLILDTMDLRLR